MAYYVLYYLQLHSKILYQIYFILPHLLTILNYFIVQCFLFAYTIKFWYLTDASHVALALRCGVSSIPRCSVTSHRIQHLKFRHQPTSATQRLTTDTSPVLNFLWLSFSHRSATRDRTARGTSKISTDFFTWWKKFYNATQNSEKRGIPSPNLTNSAAFYTQCPARARKLSNCGLLEVPLVSTRSKNFPAENPHATIYLRFPKNNYSYLEM